MKKCSGSNLFSRCRNQLATFLGAIAFYTCFPLPQSWTLKFHGIARWAPLVGLAIGLLLGLLDTTLQILGMPILTRSTLIVVVWIAITGGLHLDGVMDTADGLAVLDSERRLQVMADSRVGAFGVMAAIALLGLKTVALSEIHTDRWLALAVAAGWGRWGQLMAIAQYPYLKQEGKGAFHKAAIQSGYAAVPGLFLLIGVSALQMGLHRNHWLLAVVSSLGGAAIALAAGRYFYAKLGGHTGDTYGAVVEWTEALLLCLLSLLIFRNF